LTPSAITNKEKSVVGRCGSALEVLDSIILALNALITSVKFNFLITVLFLLLEAFVTQQFNKGLCIGCRAGTTNFITDVYMAYVIIQNTVQAAFIYNEKLIFNLNNKV
jgi:hypothetical protein